MSRTVNDGGAPPKGQPDMQGSTVLLAGWQFDKLVELLTPGYILSKAMLEDYERQKAEHAAYEARETERVAAERREMDEHNARAADEAKATLEREQRDAAEKVRADAEKAKAPPPAAD